jgi:hypothetical protein
MSRLRQGVARRLTLDPARSSPPTDKRAVAWPHFVDWFERLKTHHEFPEVETRLAHAAQKASEARPGVISAAAFELDVLWNCWRAATWVGDQFKVERLAAEGLRDAADAAGDALTRLLARLENAGEIGARFQEHAAASELAKLAETIRNAATAVGPDRFADAHLWQGPFLLIADGKIVSVARKTRQPAPGTWFAAVVGNLCRHLAEGADWTLVSRLLAVAGIESSTNPTYDDTLRVRAHDLMKQLSNGTAVFVGWPADIGPLAQDLQRRIAHINAR